MKRRYKFIILFFLCYISLQIVNCECVLPKMEIQRSGGDEQKTFMYFNYVNSGEHEIFYMDDPNVKISLYCTSGSEGPINLQYIAEEIKAKNHAIVLHRRDPNEKQDSEEDLEDYKITADFDAVNGTIQSQHYCVHLNNPCGYSEAVFTTLNQQMQGRILQHKNTTIPSLKRSPLETSNSKVKLSRDEKCAFEFFIKIFQRESFLAGKCTVNQGDEKFDGKIKFFHEPTSIEIEALLRDRTTHDGCLHFLSEEEQCENCQLFTYTFDGVPIVAKCLFDDYKAQQFFFVSTDKTNGKFDIYKSWDDISPEAMISIETPTNMFEGSLWNISCFYSPFVFSNTPMLATRRTEHGNWEYFTDTSEQIDEAEQGITYSINGTQFVNFFEVMCMCFIWNSTEYANKTQRIFIERVEAPIFHIYSEDITLYFNESGGILCSISNYQGNTTFKWTTWNKGANLQTYPQDNGSLLVFPVVSESIQGLYFCTATNYKGTTFKTFVVTVGTRSNWVWISIAVSANLVLLISILLYALKYRNQRTVLIQDLSLHTAKKQDETIALSISKIDVEIKVWKSQQPFKLSTAEPIGSGSFGKVYKILHTTLQKEFALKKIDVYTALREMNWDLNNVFREMDIHMDLNHENVVKFYNCWVENSSGLCNFDIKNYQPNDLSSSYNYTIFMQLELCTDTLANWLQEFTAIEERIEDENFSDIFHQTLNGLKALHMKNIIHRDTKPNNILYKEGNDGKKIWKIGDLGLCKRVEMDQGLTKERGCALYRSPEMMNGSVTYTDRTDVFSLGLTFFEVLYVFKTVNDKIEMFDKLRHENSSFEKIKDELVFPEGLEEEITLVGKMLRLNPCDRIGLKY